MKELNIKPIALKVLIFFLVLSCNNGKNKLNQTTLVNDNFNDYSIEKLIKNDSLILLKNSTERNFSNPKTKDKFTISIIGESILDGVMIFKIVDSDGIEILNERYPSNELINGYIFDDKSTDKELEEYIKKRVSEFFNEENFITPAINIESEYDSDYSDEKIWDEIQSDSTAVGFYYLIGLENGCKIAYSKKQKKVLKYFCCC